MRQQSTLKVKTMTELTLETITAKLKEKIAGQTPFGHTAKFVLQDLGTIVLDGTGPDYLVSNVDADTEVTLSMSVETFNQLQNI